MGMHVMRVRRITRDTFRASRRYRLVAHDRVPRRLRSVVRRLVDDPDFFGLLLPRSPPEQDAKAVCRDTATLFGALRKPATLPRSIVEHLGKRADKAIAKLVLDGILELQRGADFVSGAVAFEHLFPTATEYTLHGRTGELTLQALVSARQFVGAGLQAVANHLYRYNTAPASPFWRTRLPTRRAILDHLSTPSLPWSSTAVHRTWTLVDGAPSGHWWVWKRSSVSINEAEFRRRTLHKLFISPSCGALRDTFLATVPVLADSPAFAFKVGGDLPALLRPDKLVVYFARYEDLTESAARIQATLAGVPAQGVPFSAPLTADGLLSWGIDPAEDMQTFGWNGGESWRAWVTNRLAGSLIASSRCPDLPVAPWTFALAALELEDIEPTTFVPEEGVWARPETLQVAP